MPRVPCCSLGATFGAYREGLVARAQHLCPGAPQTSIPGSCISPRSPWLGMGSTKLTWPDFTEYRWCWGSPHQAQHWSVGYSPWQEGTCGLRLFTGREQEQKDLLGTFWEFRAGPSLGAPCHPTGRSWGPSARARAPPPSQAEGRCHSYSPLHLCQGGGSERPFLILTRIPWDERSACSLHTIPALA